MQTAIDVVKKITLKNSLLFLNFDEYQPHGWKTDTIKYFKEERKPGERRNPAGAIEHSPPNGLFILNRDEITGGELEKRVSKTLWPMALQVLSPTLRHTEPAHVPMLDVEFPPSDENLSYLISCLRALGEQEGAVLLSGASYHYYGYQLLSNSEWQKFMYKSLLLDEVVDTRWVGHRLIDGFSWLRITPKGQHNFIPYVVAEL